MKLLGFIISTMGIRVDPNKLNGVLSWPLPRSCKELQHYLSLFNYFREHLPMYSRVCTPLEQVRNATNLSLVWSAEQQNAFQTMKKILASARILSFPDFSLLFYVATRASNRIIRIEFTPVQIRFECTRIESNSNCSNR